MLFAVHLSDGILTWPWLAGGFLLAGVLVALAFPLRDEAIPRTALLTAVFFVASLLHVKVGPTSVHLLLNGLVGILLGRRAGLAIGLGLLLQAILLGHGGLTTLGVNAVVLTVPALVVGGLFGLLNRLTWVRHPWFRAGLVAVGVLAWVLTLVFAVAVLCTNPLTALVRPNVGPGFHVIIPDFSAAWRVVCQPLTLTLATLLAGLAAWLERRLGNVPEFPLGFLLGVLAVLLTAALNALVLLAGGVEGWHTVVTFVFLAHLPLAILEGIVLGFVVGFLARVKPDLLGLPAPEPFRSEKGEKTRSLAAAPPLLTLKPPTLLLAVAVVLALATPVWAHRLEAGYTVLPGQRVLVESWFETGDFPKKATVQVFRPDGSLLAEGPLDAERGTFTFRYQKQEASRVVVTAPGGHRAEVTIPAAKLPVTVPPGPPGQEQPAGPGNPTSGQGNEMSSAPPADAETGAEPAEGGVSHRSAVSSRDVISGLAFVLALGGFVLSVRQQQQMSELRRQFAQMRPLTAER